ncbi:MAG TPA: phytanoyl-CoA dioxygenase family protein [Alphaproteobacteria bacterium]|jgi:ectoine hydroxylase-related dioxygenase (phytanoyl-CoA dioxygenase family)
MQPRRDDPAAILDRPAALRAEAVAGFARDGYLVLRGAFDARTTAEIGRWTDELAEAPEVSGRHWVYHEASRHDPGRRIVQRIENFCPFHPAYDRFVRHGRLIELVSAVLGEPAVLFKEKINFKMPGGAGFKAHQDQQAGWTRYAPLFVTALVSIDPATLENGCLEIAAQWQPRGMIGEEWRPLDETAVAALDLKPVVTAPGDVILFDSFVPHASKDNLTDRPRRVLYLTYNRRRDGDHRADYYRHKHESFPPDVDRLPGRDYVFRV